MAKLRRISQPHQAVPSLHPSASRGTGTARTFLPGLGLGTTPMAVSATSGSERTAGPIELYKPDLIKAGCLPVVARSGNVSEQLLPAGADDQEYTEVGDLNPAEKGAQAIEQTNHHLLGVTIGGALMLGFIWLLHSHG